MANITQARVYLLKTIMMSLKTVFLYNPFASISPALLEIANSFFNMYLLNNNKVVVVLFTSKIKVIDCSSNNAIL